MRFRLVVAPCESGARAPTHVGPTNDKEYNIDGPSGFVRQEARGGYWWDEVQTGEIARQRVIVKAVELFEAFLQLQAWTAKTCVHINSSD